MSERATRPRVVFDCNTLFQAAASEAGPAAEALRVLDRGEIELFLSRAVLRELRAVLTYPALRRRNPDLTDAKVDAFLMRLDFRGRLLRNVRHVFDYPRDPKDEPYIDLAAAARAHYLVSRDKDLLSLMTGHSLLCKQFRQKLNPLRVVTPEVFLHEIDVDGIRSSE